MRFSLETNTTLQYEAVIVGGGPAGCAAAVACARAGKKTLLVEKSCSLGGMGTGGLVPGWCPVHTGMLEGVAREIFDRSLQSLTDMPADQEEWVPIEAEALKRVYDTIVSDSGAAVLFDTVPVHVRKEPDGKIKSIVVCNTAGLTEICADVFVDCTGNADLYRLAGGTPIRSATVQPGSLCFYLGNVDLDAFKREPILHTSNANSPIHAIVADEKYPLLTSAHFCIQIIYKNVAVINAGYLYGIDPDRPLDNAAIMMQGRAMAQSYAEALRAYTQAFRNCTLLATAPLLGVRESVRVTATYTVGIEDYLRRARFDDAIAKNDYFIDVHSENMNKLFRVHADLNETCRYYAPGEYYEIPYRSLVTDIPNLLAAGRIVGCDEQVQGSLRTMPAALSTGRAAGTAAAICVESKIAPTALEGTAVRKRLEEQGF